MTGLKVFFLAAYYTNVTGLWIYTEYLRAKRASDRGLPHPLAFFGPSGLSYIYSGKHREAEDRPLTVMVKVNRFSPVLFLLFLLSSCAAANG